MRIVRIVISLLLLLGTVGLGVVTFLVFNSEKLNSAKLPLKNLVPALVEAVPALDFSPLLWHSLAGGSVALLLLAGIFWPPARLKSRKSPPKPAASSVLDAVPASGKTQDISPVQLEGLAQEMDSPPGPADVDPDAAPEDLPEGLDSPAPAPAASDDARLRELINMEQLKLDRKAATRIIKESYPKLGHLVEYFYDEETVVTTARRVIAILRVRVKLNDPTMSSYQFSQFEDKVNQMEQEKLLYRYAPQDKSALNEQQRALLNKFFSVDSYRSVQQKLRAGREDWQHMSVEDLT